MKTFSSLILLLLTIETASSFAPPATFGVSKTTSPFFFHVTPSSVSLQAANYYDDEEDDADLVKVPRRRQRGRLFENEEEESEFYDRVEERVYGRMEDEEDDLYDDDDEDDFDDEEEGEWNYDTFENRVIDNPILDAIDPDGAYQRFPELARDPRFWIDIILFVCFLNFLSDIGPANMFPDGILTPNGETVNIMGVNTPYPMGMN